MNYNLLCCVWSNNISKLVLKKKRYNWFRKTIQPENHHKSTINQFLSFRHSRYVSKHCISRLTDYDNNLQWQPKILHILNNLMIIEILSLQTYLHFSV